MADQFFFFEPGKIKRRPISARDRRIGVEYKNGVTERTENAIVKTFSGPRVGRENFRSSGCHEIIQFESIIRNVCQALDHIARY